VGATADLKLKQVAIAFRLKGHKALVNAAGDIIEASTPRTPFKTGELRQKRRVKATRKGARIVWLAGHAAVQNAGQRAGASSFTNYTTPGTGDKFIEHGLKTVVPNLLRYFK